jgi:hypothetical protein
MKKHTSMRWWQHTLLVLRVPVCLIAAFLTGWVEPILGEGHIATVIGIVGIGIITKAKKRSL